MRYIDTSSLQDKLPESWQAKADAVLIELKAASNHKDRQSIINKNGRLWGELKDTLKELSHGKCWYTESKNDGSYGDVDHFRPKGKVTENAEHPGYWWLAFDYKNYRFSCQIANTSGKGNHFPLREGCTYVTTFDGDLDTEVFLLLDPTIENDPKLLAYREDGYVIPNSADEETYEYKRARTTIDRLYLNHPDFCDARKRILAKLNLIFKEMLTPASSHDFCQSLLQLCLSNKEAYSAFSASMLSKKMKSHPELSSLCNLG
jgi:uncharacterized protein (TIGR02646 family)